MIAAVLALSVLIGTSGGPAYADLVELKSGSRLEGRVVYQDATKLVLRNGTSEREIAMSDVRSFRSRAANLRRALARAREVPSDDLRGTLSLVGLCRELSLPEEAELFLWRALGIDRDNEAAHAALGHQRRATGWFVRLESDWQPFASLAETRSRWGDEWDFRSTHYRVRTNLDVNQALSTTLDLECLYDAFFELFARDLPLYEVTETMTAQVHADRQSFPELVGDLTAYFDPPSKTLFIRADERVDRGLIFHEGTHQILHMTAENTPAATGEIAGWLGEGLAEYMRAGLSGEPGKAVFKPDQLLAAHFAAHANAKETIGLSRMLNATASDFLAPAQSALMYAEAYTLVHFCLHGKSRLYRDGFLSFVRGAYRGRASGSHFKEAVFVRGHDFEAEWTRYVKQVNRG